MLLFLVYHNVHWEEIHIQNFSWKSQNSDLQQIALGGVVFCFFVVFFRIIANEQNISCNITLHYIFWLIRLKSLNGKFSLKQISFASRVFSLTVRWLDRKNPPASRLPEWLDSSRCYVFRSQPFQTTLRKILSRPTSGSLNWEPAQLLTPADCWSAAAGERAWERQTLSAKKGAAQVRLCEARLEQISNLCLGRCCLAVVRRDEK